MHQSSLFGLNWEFMAKYLPWYVDAAKLTVTIAFWGILLSLAVGMICAVIRYYRVPVLNRVAACYIELSRNTPLLVQLFFLYFGLPKLGIVLSAESCAIVGLAFLGGSYMCQYIFKYFTILFLFYSRPSILYNRKKRLP